MKRKVLHKFQGNAKKVLLRWVQCTAAKYASARSSCPTAVCDAAHANVASRGFQASWNRSERLWSQLA